jgi:hypothetical protein
MIKPIEYDAKLWQALLDGYQAAAEQHFDKVKSHTRAKALLALIETFDDFRRSCDEDEIKNVLDSMFACVPTTIKLCMFTLYAIELIKCEMHDHSPESPQGNGKPKP